MKILFLCVANSARSQMAEGIARKIFRDDVTVQSAGSMESYVHPCAIEALKEIDVDASTHTSKSVQTIDPKTVDTVVTLCAEEVCPAFLGQAKHYHWPQADPTRAYTDEQRLENFRKTRDVIQAKLEEEFSEFLRDK